MKFAWSFLLLILPFLLNAQTSESYPLVQEIFFNSSYWPTETEVKTFLSKEFPNRDISYNYKDSSFSFYTYVEGFVLNAPSTIGFQKNKKFWNRIDIIKKDSETRTIKVSKSGVQASPDVNTPSPTILTLEELIKQKEKKEKKGKDPTSYIKQLDSLMESRDWCLSLLRDWFVNRD